MKYNKPILFVAGEALVAVQTQRKPQAGLIDSVLGQGVTPNAYEADE